MVRKTSLEVGVCAGVEPKCFTNLFPYWEVDAVVRKTSLEVGVCWCRAKVFY